MQARELNQKVELWGLLESKNELGEISRDETKIKDIWAKVKLNHGSKKKIAKVDTEEINGKVNIRVRKLSIKNPSIDMYFIHLGIRYNVIDFVPDFKTNSFWDFDCEVIYE